MSNSAPLLLDVWAGRAVVRVRFSDSQTHARTKMYLSPARVSDPVPRTQAEAHVSENGVRIVFGPPAEIQKDQIPLFQLELLLIDWTLAFAVGGVCLHAGCVIYRGAPIVFVTESGGGKSSLTLSAVQSGATYITDDLLLAVGKTLSGLARAIRFKQISLESRVRPPYLAQMDCDSFLWEKNGKRFATPIWTGPCPSLHEFDVSNTPCVVVRVSRGPDKLTRLSEVERLVTLHEAAILRCGEYDGSLGPGPTYHLSWEDPTKAFGLLAKELEQL